MEDTACSAVSICGLPYITPDTDIKGLDFSGPFSFVKMHRKNYLMFGNIYLLIRDRIKTVKEGTYRKEGMKMYILAITAKRKNAKRHIVARNVDLETARKLARNINKRYIIEVYTGNWKLIERCD